jgi:hydroxyacylglutathione hydrolase
MKKKLKIALIILVSLLVLFILLTGAYLYKMKAETGKMSSLETREILPNLFVIKDSFVNLYLYKTGDKYIAIDAGNELNNIQNELNKLQINPENVIAVLFTHTDSDHTGALELFKNAVVYLSSKEEQMINGKTSRFFIFGNKLKCNRYNLLNDNQVIAFGDIKIQGILTPGHTPGAMCYLFNDKILFTGDAFSLSSGRVEKFNEFFNMDTETSLLSIDKLSKLKNIEYIFTAHYGFSNNFTEAFSNWKH